MPELPEVETVRRGLHELIIGRVIRRVSHDTAKSFPNAPGDVVQFVQDARVTDVRRRAKVLLIDLSSEHTLVIHLKMTGQLVFVRVAQRPPSATSKTASRCDSVEYASAESLAADVPGTPYVEPLFSPPSPFSQSPVPSEAQLRFGAGHPSDSLVGELPDRSTRVTIVFADGSHLFFNDQRKFGWMKLYPTIEVPTIDFMKKAGPEPLAEDFTWQQFRDRFVRRVRTSSKAALLDQTVVAGVGNIYADESLWGARIHPKRLVGTLTDDEFRLLYEELRTVMSLAIEKGGSTDKNYVNAEGKKGSYMDFARVFRREGLPCPRCGEPIIKLRVAGRGTHICPVCQIR